MTEVEIGKLVLRLEDAPGRAHRIQPIALRASTLFAELLDVRLRKGQAARSAQVPVINSPPLRVNLDATGDEEIARRIADAWLDALSLHLRI